MRMPWDSDFLLDHDVIYWSWLAPSIRWTNISSEDCWLSCECYNAFTLYWHVQQNRFIRYFQNANSRQNFQICVDLVLQITLIHKSCDKNVYHVLIGNTILLEFYLIKALITFIVKGWKGSYKNMVPLQYHFQYMKADTSTASACAFITIQLSNAK